jgi:hypothetical protein
MTAGGRKRLLSQCVRALQKLSGLLEHCQAEPRLGHVDQLNHDRLG